jgi:hypothetical protein
MGATFAVVAEFIGSIGVETAVAAETAGTVAATEAALTAAGATAGEAGLASAALGESIAATGAATAGATAAAAGGSAGAGSILGAISSGAAGGAAGTLVSGLLTPKTKGAAPAPVVTKPVAMPDPIAIQKAAQQKSILAQITRQGRASTILTDAGNSSGKLGG